MVYHIYRSYCYSIHGVFAQKRAVCIKIFIILMSPM
eukprot:UN18877